MMTPKAAKKNDCRILVVDDDPIFCRALSPILKKTGYAVTIVHHGKKALALLRKNPDLFDLIILDRIMPELSGIDVLYSIFTNPVLQPIPVIMLTTMAERSDVKAAITYGARDFIYKPVDETILLSAIQRILQKKSHEF